MTVHDNTAAIRHLQPESLWRIFARISSIPHCSGSEHALSDYICSQSDAAGFGIRKDAAGNICIRVPATPGFEGAPTVILQGHLDMVCEKNSSCEFDFSTGGIQLVRDGDWIRASGTSLGADNGIGIAAALAVAFSPQSAHGPLELLLTLDEETGLKGAMRLDPALVTGRILLNVDSEKTGSVCIGCAGGVRTTVRLPLHFTEMFPGHDALGIRIEGLRGGHSGLNIHENRGNAVKLLAELLAAVMETRTSLFTMSGGDRHNAIPREASAVISLPADDLEGFRDRALRQFEKMRSAHPQEGSMELSVVAAEPLGQAVPPVVLRRILNLLQGLPSGVLSMSRDIPGLVETSCNLAAARLLGLYLEIELMPRSSHAQSLDRVAAQINAIAELAGADCSSEIPYPGWQPDLSSKILGCVDDVHQSLFGFRPGREATHAGIECGIIGKKIPGIDMISFGPDISDCHSPSEKVYIPGVEKFWELLNGVLERVAKKGPQTL